MYIHYAQTLTAGACVPAIIMYKLGLVFVHAYIRTRMYRNLYILYTHICIYVCTYVTIVLYIYIYIYIYMYLSRHTVRLHMQTCLHRAIRDVMRADANFREFSLSALFEPVLRIWFASIGKHSYSFFPLSLSLSLSKIRDSLEETRKNRDTVSKTRDKWYAFRWKRKSPATSATDWYICRSHNARYRAYIIRCIMHGTCAAARYCGGNGVAENGKSRGCCTTPVLSLLSLLTACYPLLCSAR